MHLPNLRVITAHSRHGTTRLGHDGRRLSSSSAYRYIMRECWLASHMGICIGPRPLFVASYALHLTTYLTYLTLPYLTCSPAACLLLYFSCSSLATTSCLTRSTATLSSSVPPVVIRRQLVPYNFVPVCPSTLQLVTARHTNRQTACKYSQCKSQAKSLERPSSLVPAQVASPLLRVLPRLATR